MAEITIDGVTLQFSESAFTAAQWEQVASWVLNGGGEAAAENAQIALKMASEAAKSEANADEDANSAKSYAVGGTGTREGEDTDNAKFYCQQAHAIAGEGMVFSVNGVQADDVGNVNVTKENIGLDKVNNTADTEKPVSLAQQQALDLKANAADLALLIPETEKAAAGGVATLDAYQRVVQPQQWQCNPNLLHNWYFANPVNRRGETEYVLSSETYTIDRWYALRGTVSVEDDSVHFVSEQTASYKRFSQITEITKTSGVAVTVSALIKVNAVSGRLRLRPVNGANAIPDFAIGIENTTEDYELFTVSGIIPSDCTGGLGAEILVYNSTADYIDVNIKAIKLELGTQQTLAHQDADGNWVLNEIPNKGEELIRCQSAPVDLDGRGGVTSFNILWENASKNSAFAAQDLAVNTEGYDYLMFVGAYNISEANGQDVIIMRLRKPTGGNSVACLTVEYISTAYARIDNYRKITVPHTRNRVTFSGAYSAGTAIEDTYVIPYYIYGIKGVYNP